MVVFLLISGMLFGSSRMADKFINDKGKYQPNLTVDNLLMIEVIEELEIEMIKKGLNPDTLTLKQVHQILNEKIQNNEAKSTKKKKYNEFLKKIEKYRVNSQGNEQN